MGNDVATLLGPTPTPRAKVVPLERPWRERHEGHRVIATPLVGLVRFQCLDCRATHYVVGAAS